MKIKIEINRYPDYGAQREKAFAKLRELKQNKDYENALLTINYIEVNLYNIYSKFSPMITLNEQRAIIYKKMGDMPKSIYYRVLSQIGELINSAFTCQANMLDGFYFTDRFLQNFSDEKIRNAVAKYVEWFKPIADELIMAMAEIRRDYVYSRLEYDYKSSRDLDIYLYTKSERLSRAIKLIDENPFIKYYPYKINL